jgi:hypothetical protein
VVNWENNNLGDVGVWSRNSQGVYHFTLVGAFEGNVYVWITNGESTIKDWQIGAKKISDDVIAVGTSDVPTDSSIDGVMTDATIVIEVY